MNLPALVFCTLVTIKVTSLIPISQNSSCVFFLYYVHFPSTFIPTLSTAILSLKTSLLTSPFSYLSLESKYSPKTVHKPFYSTVIFLIYYRQGKHCASPQHSPLIFHFPIEPHYLPVSWTKSYRSLQHHSHGWFSLFPALPSYALHENNHLVPLSWVSLTLSLTYFRRHSVSMLLLCQWLAHSTDTGHGLRSSSRFL